MVITLVISVVPTDTYTCPVAVEVATVVIADGPEVMTTEVTEVTVGGPYSCAVVIIVASVV